MDGTTNKPSSRLQPEAHWLVGLAINCRVWPGMNVDFDGWVGNIVEVVGHARRITVWREEGRVSVGTNLDTDFRQFHRVLPSVMTEDDWSAVAWDMAPQSPDQWERLRTAGHVFVSTGQMDYQEICLRVGMDLGHWLMELDGKTTAWLLQGEAGLPYLNSLLALARPLRLETFPGLSLCNVTSLARHGCALLGMPFNKQLNVHIDRLLDLPTIVPVVVNYGLSYLETVCGSDLRKWYSVLDNSDTLTDASKQTKASADAMELVVNENPVTPPPEASDMAMPVDPLNAESVMQVDTHTDVMDTDVPVVSHELPPIATSSES